MTGLQRGPRPLSQRRNHPARIAVYALALIAAVGTQAQTGVSATTPTAAPPVSKGEAKAIRDFRLLDFNGDGRLSRTEVQLFPRLAAAFDTADTDGDGFVSMEEVRVFAARYRAERDRAKAANAPGSADAAAAAPP